MQLLDIHSRTCGLCVRTITQAVQVMQPIAKVKADLSARRLRVASIADAPRA